MKELFFLVIILLVATLSSAEGHDQWANGLKVPAWVKSACCGPEDVHQPSLSDLTENSDGSWTLQIPGSFVTFQKYQVFDSQDSEIWAFYDPQLAPRYHTGYCLFIPRTS